MSSPIEVVREMYDDFLESDLGRIRARLAEDVEYRNPEHAIEPGVRRGPDEFCTAIEALHAMFEYASTDAPRLIPLGDHVVADYRVHAKGRTSRAPIEGEAGHWWTVRAGKVTRFEWFTDYGQALAAVRAVEPEMGLVVSLYEAWTAGRAEELLSDIDPDIEWIEPADSPDRQRRNGPAGVLESMAEWTEPFEDYRVEIKEVVRAGDHVLVESVQAGKGRGSEVEIRSPLWHLWTVRDGKAVRAEMFREREEALAAAGARLTDA
jgi:uncharacterized protein